MKPEVGEYWKVVETGIRIEVRESKFTEDNLYVKAVYELLPSHFIEVEINLPPQIFECYFRREILLPCTACKNNTFNLLRREAKQVSRDIVDGFGSTIEDGKRVFSHLQCRNCKEQFIRFDTENNAEMSVVNPSALDEVAADFVKQTVVIPTSFAKKEKPNLSNLFVGANSLDCPSCSDGDEKIAMNSVTAKGITIYTCGICGHSEERNE